MPPPPRRRPRRPARRRKETLDAAASSSARRNLPSARTSALLPLSLDATRYAAFRAGVSKEELAARESTTPQAIARSIEKMETQRELYSAEAVDVAIRRSVLEASPTAHASLISALTATKEYLHHIDGDPGRTEYVEGPDHVLRMQAISKLTDMITSIKESSPLVSVSQQNNLQQNFNAGAASVSTESLIRRIREERGLALPAEIVQQDVDNAPLPDETDFELQAELEEEAAEAAEAAEEAAETEEEEPELPEED